MSEQRPWKSRYDVVVVGARCAGAATARLLAAAGLDVLLLDRTRLPADSVSTHALMRGGVVQLRRWGLLDAVAATGATPVDAIDMRVNDVAFTARVKPIAGVDTLYAPRRLVLDAILVQAAESAGAELSTGATVEGVVRQADGRVAGVTGVSADGRPFTVSARWVVGADGVRSTVAALVQPGVQRSVPPLSASHYAYWSGLEGHRYEFAFGRDTGAGAIPTDAGLTCVYASCPTAQVRDLRGDLEGGFRRILTAAAPELAERVAGGRRETGYRGVRGLPSYLRTPWGPGWLLVGDAGYHRDPFSAHGMTDAFRDAELAARAILDAAGGTSSESVAMARFHLLRDDFAEPVFDATARIASYAWDTDELLDILAMMGDEGEREAYFLDDLPQLPRLSGGAAA